MMGTPPVPKDEEGMTKEEAVEVLGVSASTVYMWIREQRVPS